MLNIVGDDYIAYGIPLNQCVAFDYGGVVATLVSFFLANQVYGEVARNIVDAQLFIFFRFLLIVNDPSAHLIAGIGSSREDDIFAACYSLAVGYRCAFCCASRECAIAAELFIINDYSAFVALETNEEVDRLSWRYRPSCFAFQLLIFDVLAVTIFKEPICDFITFDRRSSESHTLARRDDIAALEFFAIHYTRHRTTGSIGRLEEYAVTFREFVAMRYDVKIFVDRLNLKYFRVLRISVDFLAVNHPVRKFVSREFVAAFHLERTAFGHFAAVFYSNRARSPSLDKA